MSRFAPTIRLLLSWMGVVFACGFPARNICQAETVFPGAAWQRATPESQRVDPAKLKRAVDYVDQEFGRDEEANGCHVCEPRGGKQQAE